VPLEARGERFTHTALPGLRPLHSPPKPHSHLGHGTKCMVLLDPLQLGFKLGWDFKELVHF